MVDFMENNKNTKNQKKYDTRNPRDFKTNGKKIFDAKSHSRDYSKQREEYSKPREEVNTEGLVIGRNAVRELLKSGREIDKLLVQRGEREGSIVVLVAEAIERGIPVVESDKAKLEKELKKLKEKYQKSGKSMLKEVDSSFKFKKAVGY